MSPSILNLFKTWICIAKWHIHPQRFTEAKQINYWSHWVNQTFICIISWGKGVEDPRCKIAILLRNALPGGWGEGSVVGALLLSAADSGSVPRTHTLAHSHPQLTLQGIWHSLLSLVGTRQAGYAHTFIRLGKIFIHLKISKSIFKRKKCTTCVSVGHSDPHKIQMQQHRIKKSNYILSGNKS